MGADACEQKMTAKRPLRASTLPPLTHDQRQHLVLGHVFLPSPPKPTGFWYFPFDSEEQRRDLYFAYREELLRSDSSRRPAAFYDYEDQEGR